MKNVDMKQAITITFGDVAENHVGNEKIGVEAEYGFSYDELRELYNHFKLGYDSRLISPDSIEFVELSIGVGVDGQSACVLIVRNGVNQLINNTSLESNDDDASNSVPVRDYSTSMYLEHDRLTPDSKYFDARRKRVLNKHARHNLCFDVYGHEANYEEGIGTVVSFDDVPITSMLRDSLSDLLGSKADELKAEANYYYDPDRCGIGYHGDTERRIVVGVRLGRSIPLCYQWFHRSKPIGDRVTIELNHGDIYVMSEKAVGRDWKKKTIPTLRHAAGCSKYVDYDRRDTKLISIDHSAIAKDRTMVRNPKTNRYIKVGGKIYADLVKQGYFADE